MSDNERVLIAKLTQLGDEVPEDAHIAADDMILEFIEKQGFSKISAAYRELREKVGFYYA